MRAQQNMARRQKHEGIVEKEKGGSHKHILPFFQGTKLQHLENCILDFCPKNPTAIARRYFLHI